VTNFLTHFMVLYIVLKGRFYRTVFSPPKSLELVGTKQDINIRAHT